MKQVNELTAGEIFQFVEKNLKYGICKLDGGMDYRTCNNKFFKYLGCGQFCEVEKREGYERYFGVKNGLFNCYITGRGENKKLYYENVTIVNN